MTQPGWLAARPWPWLAWGISGFWLVWARSSCTHRRRRRVRRSWRSIAFSKKRRDFEQLHRHLSSRSGEAMWLAVPSKQSNRLIAVVSYAYTFASLVHGAAMRRARGARELHVRAFWSLYSSGPCTGAYMACTTRAGARVVGWRSTGQHAVEQDMMFTVCDCVGPCAQGQRCE